MPSRPRVYRIDLDESGRITLPQGCLRRSGVSQGDTVVLSVEGSELIIRKASEDVSDGFSREERTRRQVGLRVG